MASRVGRCSRASSSLKRRSGQLSESPAPALVKSGTATLELAIAGVPMVAAYKGGNVEAWVLRRVIRVTSVILANLVIGENVVPEFLQEDCTPDRLAPALRDILADSSSRRRQLEAFAKLDTIMSTGNQPPSVRAADIVLATLNQSPSKELRSKCKSRTR